MTQTRATHAPTHGVGGAGRGSVPVVHPAAAHQQHVDELREVASDVRLEIQDVIVGRVRILGWDRNEMQIGGTVGDDVQEVLIDGTERHVEIEVELPDDDEGGRRNWRRRDHRDVDVDLEIHLPYGASVEVTGVTMSTYIENIDGRIEVESVTGEIEVIGRGRILDLATVTGNMTVRVEELERGDFETVQGAIRFEGGLASGARVDAEAVGGDIELRLPDGVSASFDVETFSGDIDNEFGPDGQRNSRWVPSKELRFSTGGGDARVSIETLQGSVRILRQ